MRNIFLFISGILLASCVSKKDSYDVVRKTPKQKLTPPGTVWLRDNLFIDETEITNFSYNEYLSDLKRKDITKYILAFPDTACWEDFSFYSINHDLYYLKHPAFRNYPVVGISYNQAVEFCKWRSFRVNQYLYITKNKIKKYSVDSVFNAPEYVRYRLPSKEEWEYAAAAGLKFCDFPLGYQRLIDKNKIPVSNTLEYFNYHINNNKTYTYTCRDSQEVVYPTVAVYEGKPNIYGLYNLLGNVSEIISDSLVKGLNYNAPIYSVEIKELEDDRREIHSRTYNYKIDTKYKRPEPWIGFRCICEVLK